MTTTTQQKPSSICCLTRDFRRDIIYDCHPIGTSYSRSKARASLVALGPLAFASIARMMKRDFSDLNVTIDTKMFLAWIYLIYDIVDEHNLPDPPYGTDVPYGEQTLKPWHDFCIAKQR